jgi:hypothetical protein
LTDRTDQVVRTDRVDSVVQVEWIDPPFFFVYSRYRRKWEISYRAFIRENTKTKTRSRFKKKLRLRPRKTRM